MTSDNQAVTSAVEGVPSLAPGGLDAGVPGSTPTGAPPATSAGAEVRSEGALSAPPAPAEPPSTEAVPSSPGAEVVAPGPDPEAGVAGRIPEAGEGGVADSSSGGDEAPAEGGEVGEADELFEAGPVPVAAGRPSGVPIVLIPLALVEDDDTFKLREDVDVAGLATSIARVGQYVPIDVRPRGERVQVIAGFRRLAAVRMLHREHVLARIHDGMSDADAVVLALVHGLEQRGLTPEQLQAVSSRLEANDSLSAQARGLIEAALVTPGSDLEPEGGESDEVDLDELARDLEQRLSGISSDLAAVTELWDEMEEGPQAALLDQLRYYAELHAFLSRRR